MALGNSIIVSSGSGSPRGVFKEGTIAVGATPKPGTVMEIDYGVEPVSNRHTWQPYGTQAADNGQGVTADGDRKVIAILLEKSDEYQTVTEAYAAGDRCFLYFPIMGEEFNMLIEDVSGTGDDFTPGEELMVDNGTGKLLTADSDAEAHPFTCLETITNPTADHLAWVQYNNSAG